MPVDLAPISAVLFDLDNTLLDRDAAVTRFWRQVYRDSQVIRRTHTEEEALALLLSLDAQGRRSRKNFFDAVLRQWPGLFRDFLHETDVYYSAFPRMYVLEPETRRLLEGLGARGVSWGVVTNGSSTSQRAKIRETGLEALVRVVIVSEEVGLKKPDRRIFELALKQIDASPSETIFVGDDTDADILGAKEAGMRTAWVHRGRSWPYEDRRPDYVLGDVTEARDIVLGP